MGFGLTPLLGDRRGFMPPQLKTKQDIQAGEKRQKRINTQGLLFGTLEYLTPGEHFFYPERGQKLTT